MGLRFRAENLHLTEESEPKRTITIIQSTSIPDGSGDHMHSQAQYMIPIYFPF